MSNVLLYTGGALPVLWGTAHLFPTGRVVRGFGRISRDNQLVLTMEWIAVGAGERLTPLRRLRFDPTCGCGRRRPG